MITFAKIILIAALMGSVVSCRNPSQESRLQTLDNVGSRTGNFEACAGTGSIHPKASLDDEDHLKRALAAVPFKIQQGFFGDLGGRIRISHSNECMTTSSREDDALSCWRRLKDPHQSIEIIIRRSTKAKEQYALVRSFGFIYGDILISRTAPKDSTSPLMLSARPGGNLSDYKTHLASIFLGELYASVDSKSKAELSKVLSEVGIPESITSEQNFEKRWEKFSKLSYGVQDSFSSRIFAEAFHSQFCTKRSLETACMSYPMTMESFKPYSDDILNAGDSNKFACRSSRNASASATHMGWFTQNQKIIAQRNSRGLDVGSFANNKIALAVGDRGKPQTSKSFRLSSNEASLSLNNNFLQQLMGLLTGGISGGGDGAGGFIEQIFGNLSGGGLGDFGNFGGLLSQLGIEDLIGDNSNPIDSLDNSINNSNSEPQQENINGNNKSPNNIDLPSGGNATAEEKAGIDATNRYRQSKGKSVLQIDQQLIDDCRRQAKLQAERGGLTHWLYPAGIARAENIAYGSRSGDYTVMQQWVKSPGHHANIMGNHRFIGIGNFGNQWCQRFR